jgi:glucan phosphoethanolaminetransferase (alkaline phosphatase superfamily)
MKEIRWFVGLGPLIGSLFYIPFIFRWDLLAKFTWEGLFTIPASMAVVILVGYFIGAVPALLTAWVASKLRKMTNFLYILLLFIIGGVMSAGYFLIASEFAAPGGLLGGLTAALVACIFRYRNQQDCAQSEHS